MVSPDSHHKGISWEVRNVRQVLRLKICECCESNWFPNQNRKTESACFGPGMCEVTALSGQLGGRSLASAPLAPSHLPPLWICP